MGMLPDRTVVGGFRVFYSLVYPVGCKVPHETEYTTAVLKDDRSVHKKR